MIFIVVFVVVLVVLGSIIEVFGPIGCLVVFAILSLLLLMLGTH